MTTITAGKNKNMGNINDVLTPEQIAILQSIADQAYLQFTEIVAESRDLDIETVWEIADGRVYTAQQAYELDLVDDIATYKQALSIIEEAMELKDITFVSYAPAYKKTFYELLMTAYSSIVPSVESLESQLIKTKLHPSTMRYPAYYYE